ncbi:DUF1998 domain-containing protein [Pseudomonas aeruginosa]|uniref:DUF1998 domain-containing protein n=1 Tax=Pseudomonas aeruginosa TaxID=287 RepID=UPI000AA70E99|nr:DUF1998 domain-containing protein [Pseudomonas aeruginosa]KAA5601631.1 DUF1998 domain-containing protein [Pseudomonas aeruginosa]MBW6337506.1 DUF1998 domain-containing protein [Pseudomonas aeruginosa]MCJ0606868.1 DUF1998 domain-containing protein [Pseudomonas aeruginosa]MCJ0612409.1 DUF1998 domain-containing protein [Pseudomonas aeruginosa]MCJ0621646.1 DUF1998 domain-containing protein [Pseudomonas aeruginosa]
MSSRRVVRQGQLISPFGVGAIIDIGSESFVMADISRWSPDGMRQITDSNLEVKLKRPIKAPIAKDGVRSVAIHRFPRWYFCPRCRLMRFVTGADDVSNDYKTPTCADRKCGGELTPMGFVAACKHGHMSEVDWHWWAHSSRSADEGKCSRQGARMWFETTGQAGGDWSAVSVRCGCGARRDFTGLVQVEAPHGMRCGGGQPWQFDPLQCSQPLWVNRRAASNLHFPRTISALDLLHANSTERDLGLKEVWRTNLSWSGIKTLSSAGVPVSLILQSAESTVASIADKYGCDLAVVREALVAALAVDELETEVEDDSLADVQAEILDEEWQTLSGVHDVETDSLIIKRTKIPSEWPSELLRTIRSVSLVRRLREVRAILGFRRISPDEESPMIPVDLGQRPSGWYPGVEAWGEGVFIQLDADTVKSWEQRVSKTHSQRLKVLADKAAGFGWQAAMASPRFLLLHSFAHAVLRRLSFDAGYSVSSIRERIYAGPTGSTTCGILLYTADGDSEGSLGGLVRMGEPERLGALLQAALLDIAWCSADPVCKESEHQGLGGMSAASCHACMLVSETSCAFNNCLLDRRTLVDLGGVEPFFRLDDFMEGT